MQRIFRRIKPVRGFAHSAHLALNLLLPLLVYIFIRIDFLSLAIAVILLSKWRVFSVRMRYWLINLLSNSIDILVAISLALFMANTSSRWWQLAWVAIYGAWLTLLKPRSDVLSVSAQAAIGQLLAISAFYVKFGDAPLAVMVLVTGAICYAAARHFFTSFNEPYTQLISQIWAYFAACLAFVLSHWLLFYGIVPEIVLLLSVVGYGLAALYYLQSSEMLSAKLQRRMLTLMLAIVFVIIAFSDRTGRPV